MVANDCNQVKTYYFQSEITDKNESLCKLNFMLKLT